jgi:hypothetical protein
MTAPPHAAKALTSAYDRLESASLRLLEAVSGGREDAGDAIADMVAAKAEARAKIAVIRFSDDMLRSLLEIV